MIDEHMHVPRDWCAHADVGLAKLLSSAQTMASAVGTFDWAAPEILAGAGSGLSLDAPCGQRSHAHIKHAV